MFHQPPFEVNESDKRKEIKSAKTKAKPVSLDKSIKEKLKKYREEKKAPIKEKVWKEDFISLENNEKSSQKNEEGMADKTETQETNQEVKQFKKLV